MKKGSNTRSRFMTSQPRLIRIAIFIALATVAIFPLLSASSASLNEKPASASKLNSDRFNTHLTAGNPSDLLGLFAPVQETISTFAADCTTPKTSFILGETVCAKTDGVTLNEDRFVNWILQPSTVVSGGAGVTDITTNPQQFLYMPTAIGSYKVSIAIPTDISETPAGFTVTAAPPIATYDSACTTAKTTFSLNEVVCVKVDGVPVNTTFPNKIAWVDPAGLIEQKTELTTDPQTDNFQLPATDSNELHGITVENRGTWRVDVTRNNGRIKESAYFKVVDELNPAAHLVLHKFVEGLDGTVEAGADVAFILTLTNQGPDAATNVVLSDETPANTTLSSLTKTSGAAFTCVDSDCSIASLAPGETAEFRAVYNVGSSVAGGTFITNIALVTSPTSDTDDTTRTATARAKVVNAANEATCALECPENITVTATSSSGAIVTFGGGEPNGTCGTVTSTPASGSLFPIGSTLVTTNSSIGGGSCSFLVNVVEVAAPTITCPLPDITGTATGAETETSVSVTPPAATGNNVAVTGTRSDNRAISDPYPVGTTFISWVATEFFGTEPGRQASCTQKVIVTSADAPTITCPSNKSFTANGCEITLTAGDIGSPTATGSNVTVTSRRSDDLALTDPFPTGTTVITWTATDDGGRIASCSQTISVSSSGFDTTPPTLNVPGPVSVSTTSCSALLDDELGVATADDGCSGVTITRTGIPKVSCPSNPNGCETFIFPTGTTTITYTATDAAGNVTTGTQLVTVTEFPTVPPTITAPGDLNLNTGAGATSCGLLVTDATLGTAIADDNCPGETVVRTGVPAGNFFPVGPTTITYTVTDASGNTAFDTQTVTVTDNTPPTITAPADVTLYTGLGATSCGVTVADLDTTLGTAATGDNCPGTVTVARGNVPAGNVFPLGDTIVSYTATDGIGNSSAPVTQKVTVVDNTAPTISCPANVTVNLPVNPTATSMVVNYPAATASDNCPGAIGIVYSQATGTVFPVGPTTVTATATDAHGNTASCTFTVTVLYNFTGFFSPVNNAPTLNSVNAGRAIPVKFSLSGNKGLNIFAVNNPYSTSLNCSTNDPGVDVTETVTAGGSSLSYSTDQYVYTWKTESSWAGTCRQLVVTLNDGSVHVANFKFK